MCADGKTAYREQGYTPRPAKALWDEAAMNPKNKKEPRKMEEVTACPKCGEPDYLAEPFGSYYGGSDGAGNTVRCKKCGNIYNTWRNAKSTGTEFLERCVR